MLRSKQANDIYSTQARIEIWNKFQSKKIDGQD